MPESAGITLDETTLVDKIPYMPTAEQLISILGTLISVAATAFVLGWRAKNWLTDFQRTLQAEIQAGDAKLEQALKDDIKARDERLRAEMSKQIQDLEQRRNTRIDQVQSTLTRVRDALNVGDA